MSSKSVAVAVVEARVHRQNSMQEQHSTIWTVAPNESSELYLFEASVFRQGSAHALGFSIQRHYIEIDLSKGPPFQFATFSWVFEWMSFDAMSIAASKIKWRTSCLAGEPSR